MRRQAELLLPMDEPLLRPGAFSLLWTWLPVAFPLTPSHLLWLILAFFFAAAVLPATCKFA